MTGNTTGGMHVGCGNKIQSRFYAGRGVMRDRHGAYGSLLKEQQWYYTAILAHMTPRR